MATKAPAENFLVTAGSLTLDLPARTLTFGGRRIEFTDRECALLAYFMRHAEVPLSRQSIFDALWVGQGSVSINVVDVYVGYLRRKLAGSGESTPLIQTVRGFGFVFKPPAV